MLNLVSLTNAIVFLLFLSIIVGSATGILAWRERPKPGTIPLVGLVFGQNWWSIAFVFRLQSEAISAKLFWNNIAWVGIAIVPVAWVFFALEYAGRDRMVNSNLLKLLGIVPIVTMGLVLIWPYQGLLLVQSVSIGSNGLYRIGYGGLWYHVISGFAYVMGVIGILVLLDLIHSRLLAFRRQALALLVGMAVPYITNLAYLFDLLPNLGVDPTPIGFSVSGVLFLLAIKRFKLLDTSPAPNRQARKLVFDQMQESVVVVDANNHIVDINQPAQNLLGDDRKSILGEDAEQYIPEFGRIPTEGTLEETLTVQMNEGEKHLQIESVPIQSSQETVIGHVISIYEVTEFVSRQQRLEVLNRILRHNIRTETNLIAGHAEQVPGKESELVQEHAMEIKRIGDKSRDAIELFEAANQNPKAVSLETIIEGAIQDTPVQSSETSISFSPPDNTIPVTDILVAPIRNAIENAIIHGNSPTVEIRARQINGTAAITIRDDGPGISEYEIDVLRSGTETDLEHTSGLGLWIIKWGVDLAGGSLRFESSDQGTTIRMEVPILEEKHPTEGSE